MRKIFKKIATVVAAVSMVAAMATTAFAAADSVRVVGEEGLTGANWDLTGGEMTKNADGTYEISYTGIKAGDYTFKVVKGDAWGDAYNLEGAANGMGDDAKVTVAKDNSTVVIKFDGTKGSVDVKEGTTAATTPEPEKPATQEKPATPAPSTGDASAVAAMVALAALAGTVAVVARKKVVCE